MAIHISPETEALLANTARRLGISVDALVQRFLDEGIAAPVTERRELPEWDLGAIGALHRRDIYDDVG